MPLRDIMNKKLYICLIGFGSIGKRHINNIVHIASERDITVHIDLLRHSKKSPKVTLDCIRHEVYSYDDLSMYDMIFITNPSQDHAETLRKVHAHGRYIFVEKPLVINPLGQDMLDIFGDSNKFYIACPLRHTKVYEFLEKYIREEKIYAARGICSSYLPDWRPSQDYRTLYSAKKESGGVKFDLIHEFDYFSALFGIPEKFSLFEGAFSHLEQESSDLVMYQAQYPDKLVQLQVDYFGRFPQRYIELYSKNDTIKVDFIDSKVEFLAGQTVEYFPDSVDERYIREMRFFFDLIEDKVKNINNLHTANNLITLLQS